MYLPVLLIRDFGWWSFAAFAIPNCLGAMAFGWGVATEARSRSLVLVHTPAVQWFAGVTAAFQAFFLCWLIGRAATPSALASFGGAVVGLVGGTSALAGKGRDGRDGLPLVRAWPIVPVYLISLLCIVVFAASHPTAGANDWPTSARDLALLAPVCVLGFMLCPLLDPTFHAACRDAWRRGGAGASRRAFALGFLLFFPAMIGFTALYAPSLLAGATRGALGSSPPSLASPIVAFHLAMQAMVTCVLHLASVGRSAGVMPAARGGSRARTLTVVVLAAGLLAIRGDVPFEIGYRLFMSFYALVFPAYVWICMLPTFGAPATPTRRQWLVLALAVAMAGPFFWLGFIELRYGALAPGVAIVLIARLGVGRAGPTPSLRPGGASEERAR